MEAYEGPISRCVITRIATTRSELLAAYRLAYRCGFAAGYVRPHPNEIVYRDAFALPASRTLVAMGSSAKVVGTLTLIGENPLGFDAEANYAEELARLRSEGHSLAEVTSLVVEHDDDTPLVAFRSLTRFMYQYAQWSDYSDLIMVVHPRHYPFYRRWFAAVPLGSECRYAPAQGKPGIGCRIDVAAVQKHLRPDLFDYYIRQRLPRIEFAREPMDAADGAYFSRLAAPQSPSADGVFAGAGPCELKWKPTASGAYRSRHSPVPAARVA